MIGYTYGVPLNTVSKMTQFASIKTPPLLKIPVFFSWNELRLVESHEICQVAGKMVADLLFFFFTCVITLWLLSYNNDTNINWLAIQKPPKSFHIKISRCLKTHKTENIKPTNIWELIWNTNLQSYFDQC